MKLLVVGGVAGGASAAARMRRLDEKAEVLVLERGKHVSFSNCCLPYYLSSIVADSDDLVLMSPERFKKTHNIETRVLSEVLSINRKEHSVRIRDLASGKEYEEKYDKLILSPGAAPIRPTSILGVNGKNVFTVRNVTDIEALKDYITLNNCENIAVIGGGFIGIECVENLIRSGANVSLIEAMNQVLTSFDYDLVQTLHKELYDNGVNMYLSSKVTSIDENKVVFINDGREQTVKADAVILAIGVAPENSLAKDAGIEIGATGGIKVNEVFQTSDKDIYAVGDAIEIKNKLTGKSGRLALAGPAQRQARAAINHIFGIKDKKDSFSYIGSSCIRVFGLNAACTGLNERAAKQEGIDHDSVYVLPADKVGVLPGSNYMGLKLVFQVPSGKILGAQAIGKGDVTQRIDTIAAMITMGGTLDDLKELELCYAPVFGTAKDVVNLAALVGLNVLEGRVKQIPVTKVRELVESGAYILDVREVPEYKNGHLNNAHNIPLSQLRQRLDEVPRDKTVYVHCRTSQRSYYAAMCLKGYGFDNIVNIQGSFLGISLYEYFNDKTCNRTPIMNFYNFR